jgi:hypothetical protein
MSEAKRQRRIISFEKVDPARLEVPTRREEEHRLRGQWIHEIGAGSRIGAHLKFRRGAIREGFQPV